MSKYKIVFLERINSESTSMLANVHLSLEVTRFTLLIRTGLPQRACNMSKNSAHETVKYQQSTCLSSLYRPESF